MRFVLASSSPARLATLRHAGIEPEVIEPRVDESTVVGLSPGETAMTLARLKSEEVAARIHGAEECLIVGCDSLLEFDQQAYGKPGTPDQAIIRWYRMRGRQGVLHTGHHVTLRSEGGTRSSTRLGSTTVSFGDLTDAEIAAYAATGEPQRVAGAFTIDGYGGAFISRIDGDPHNVTGLSLPLLRQMLLDLGVPWHTLWSAGGSALDEA